MADKNIDAANCRSRSEFIEDAIKYYAASVIGEEHTDVLTGLVTGVTRGIVRTSEDRLSRLIFKLAVEMAKIMSMIAPLCEVEGDALRELHDKCVDEVKHINGIIKLETVIRSGA